MNARFRSFAAVSLVLAITASSGSPAAAQTRTAFRVSQLTIADPEIFLTEINNCGNALNPIVNGLLINGSNGFLTTCEPVTEGVPDPCTFSLNLVAVFTPLVTTAAGANLVQCMSAGMPCTLEFGVIDTCTRTGGTSGTISCSGESNIVAPTTYFNGGNGATCLAGLPGTFGPNNNGVNSLVAPVTGTATNNCMATGELELTLDIGDGVITIPLRGAQLAARYNATATGLTNGLARGFLAESDADQIMIDIDITTPVVLSIHEPLSYLLAGGASNCKTTVDDRDYNPPGDMNGERGWWFYLGFQATLATVPEFPTPTATFTIGQDTPTPTPSPTDTPVPTSTSTNTPVPTSTSTNTPVPTNTPAGVSCAGDCDGDGMVPINEVQRVANIYLGTQELSGCPAADRNGDLEVAINEVVLASRSYQFDCPMP